MSLPSNSEDFTKMFSSTYMSKFARGMCESIFPPKAFLAHFLSKEKKWFQTRGRTEKKQTDWFIDFSIFLFYYIIYYHLLSHWFLRLQHLGSVVIYHRNLLTNTTAGRMERKLMSTIRFEFLKMRAFSIGQQVAKLDKLINPARYPTGFFIKKWITDRQTDRRTNRVSYRDA